MDSMDACETPGRWFVGLVGRIAVGLVLWGLVIAAVILLARLIP
jgi:hypothetical protein